MIPYFVVFGILAVFAILDVFDGGQELRKRTLFLFFVILCFFAAMNVGDQDHANYELAFRESIDANVLDKQSLIGKEIYFMEPGYRLLNKLISFFTHQSFFIFAITAFVTLLLNFKVYKKYSPYFLFSVLLYYGHIYLVREMIQIRFGIASAICLYSISFIVQKRWKIFVLLVGIAAMFHTIAWVFLLMYPFYWLKMNRNNYAWMLIVCLCFAWFFPIGRMLSYLPDISIFYKIKLYVDSQQFNQTLGVISNPVVLKSIIVSVVGIYFYSVLSEEYAFFRLLFAIYIFGACWLLVFNDFSIVAGRVATLFTSSEVIIVPMYISLLQKNLFHKMLSWCIIVGYCFMTIFLNLYNGNVLPYQYWGGGI
ncbi:EpsG family protein [Butyricimonas sp. Marseille-P3923]|uniref:EpsG family protein n=1 Tax=Butyricimonas sp. Marseille-P3923 TaxID=1987504 RepID=UPI000C074E15|nr:EpsG family protein [Butyricimonas sp. Marseille-P3923]